jgi:4-hydroxy-3-methylbut-2-enyl diphosphate reductase
MVEHVIDALRGFAEVEVSTMAGREEHVEFRLPAELSDDLPAQHNAR